MVYEDRIDLLVAAAEYVNLVGAAPPEDASPEDGGGHQVAEQAAQEVAQEVSAQAGAVVVAAAAAAAAQPPILLDFAEVVALAASLEVPGDDDDDDALAPVGVLIDNALTPIGAALAAAAAAADDVPAALLPDVVGGANIPVNIPVNIPPVVAALPVVADDGGHAHIAENNAEGDAAQRPNGAAASPQQEGEHQQERRNPGPAPAPEELMAIAENGHIDSRRRRRRPAAVRAVGVIREITGGYYRRFRRVEPMAQGAGAAPPPPPRPQPNFTVMCGLCADSFLSGQVRKCSLHIIFFFFFLNILTKTFSSFFQSITEFEVARIASPEPRLGRLQSPRASPGACRWPCQGMK